ncbi:MAG: glycyl-radical enzyme activating protein [Desulfobacteraceae bacterium]|nr:MAG: glycyl-radical enzyme activating protein [Desulfobacteraceae bacterium]
MCIEIAEKQATIFDIQRFSIHDGPGIRTTIFFKGCPLRCRWCQNPESHKSGIEIAFYKERCAFCFDCKDVCPENAILESEGDRIDFDRCSSCGQCVSACKNGALRLVGATWNAPTLLDEVLKDKDFFDDSEGGITLSGGEPTVYHAFLREFLPLVKNKGVHVNMETCGMVKWNHITSILPFLDLIFYDLKLMDSKAHQMYTGVDNTMVIKNLSNLAAKFSNLQARMPVIPTINDTQDNIADIVRLLKKNNLKTIHLLPYHKLGEAKLTRIKTDLEPLNLVTDDSDYLFSAKKLFENQGIYAILYD